MSEKADLHNSCLSIAGHRWRLSAISRFGIRISLCLFILSLASTAVAEDKGEWLHGRLSQPLDLNKATMFVVGAFENRSAMTAVTMSAKTGWNHRGGIGIRRGSNAGGWFTVHNDGDGARPVRMQSTEPSLSDIHHVLTVTFDKQGGMIQMFIDGQPTRNSLRPTDRSRGASDSIQFAEIGAHGNGAEWFLNGQIAEWIVFARVLNQVERRQVHQMLAHKYGLRGRENADRGAANVITREAVAHFAADKGVDLVKGEMGRQRVRRWQGHSQFRHALTQKTTAHMPTYVSSVAELSGKPAVQFGQYVSSYRNAFAPNPKSADEPFCAFQPIDIPWLTAIVVAKDGTVLVFKDQRKTGKIEVTRSEDGGRNWQRPIVVGELVPVEGDTFDGGRYKQSHFGRSILGNAIVDDTNGDILVFASSLKPSNTLYRSRDHGKTWKMETTTISKDVNGWLSSTMSTSEAGITLQSGKHRGRLLMPTRVFVGYFNKGGGPERYKQLYANALFSDDHGKTWTPSSPFPLAGTGESALAELSDGTVYYNSRTHTRPGNRRVAHSTDGGKTWQQEHEDDELWDGPPDVYGCKAGLVRLPWAGTDTLLYSAPGRRDKREDITIFMSRDGGKSWPYKKLLRKGPGNYTWLAVGRPGTASANMIYLISNKDWIARFNLAWLRK